MKTEEIPGEVKRCRALRNFVFQGESIAAGQILDVDADTFLELDAVRPPRVQFVYGGAFKVERMRDGFHKVSIWGRPYTTEEPWVKVEFLVDVPGLMVKAGDKRRLRISHAREFPHLYLDSPTTLAPGCSYAFPPVWKKAILIHERRPRRISDEEIAERQAAVVAGMARENSYMAQTFRN
jgi:hypothetical protein